MDIGTSFYTISKRRNKNLICLWEHGHHFGYPKISKSVNVSEIPTIADCEYVTASISPELRERFKWENKIKPKLALGFYSDAKPDEIEKALEFYQTQTSGIEICCLDDVKDIDQFRTFISCKYKMVTNVTSWWGAWFDCSIESHIWGRNAPRLRIGAFYQCYKQPKAFQVACESFRSVYPNSSFIIVSDNGNNYSQLANQYNAIYWKNETQSGNGKTTQLTSLDRAIGFLHNFTNAARQIKEDWFFLCEDDTNVTRALSIEQPQYDVISMNKYHFPERVKDRLGGMVYYGCCGGTLFKTQFIASIKNDEWLHSDIREFGELTGNVFHLDIMLSYLITVRDGTMGFGKELYPSEFGESRTEPGVKCPAIWHEYKFHYD